MNVSAWVPVIQPLVTLLVGGGAAAIAVWGVKTQRGIARKRATLDIILNQQRDRDLIEARSTFMKLAESGELDEFDPFSKASAQATEHIRITLNQHEILALGIRRGIVDYQIVREWQRSSIVSDWTASKALIEKIRSRTQKPHLYCEFEAMANWMSDRATPPSNGW